MEFAAMPVSMMFGVVMTPAEEMLVDAVPPKAAPFAVSAPAKRFVVVALVAVRVASDELPETVSDPSVPTLVREEETTLLASVVPVSVPAGATTATVPAAVMSPLPLTVKVGIAVEEPKAPVLVLTVASVAIAEPGPLAVISPVSAVI